MDKRHIAVRHHGSGTIGRFLRLNAGAARSFALALGLLSVAAPATLMAQDASVPEMVLVEGGNFSQGSNEQPFASNERVHETELRSFLIATTETTQALWDSVTGPNPSKFPGAQRPVDSVSWLAAVKFCNELSEARGLEPAYAIHGSSVTWNRDADGFRLPTEAEWEYAARGGAKRDVAMEPLAKSPFAGGTDADDVAWFERNSGKASKPVATKAPNELGLYDMSGNVWEWCWDWYGPYPKNRVVDPAGPDSPTGQRVLRGGAWFTPAQLLRITYRYWNVPSFKASAVGFRLARNAPAEEAAVPAGASKDVAVASLDRTLRTVGLDIYEVLAPPSDLSR